ncbi:CPBP family intramembrane glutamic endopeptidase [Hymenobacter sp. 102]|uniref:CPBP family intramembrane glutamic endopeptidase n=1 Tax=Hymenobacter sp. 102 TaxID=3403152 RepID=UPI003CF6D878
MKKRLLLAILTLATFLLACFGPRYVDPLLGWHPRHFSDWAFSLHRAAWWLGLPMLMLAGWYGWRRVLPELGWRASLLTGLLMGLGCTLPMLLGYALLFPMAAVAPAVLASHLLRGAVWAGLSEETLFRGFLFGQFYRRVRLPWLLTVVVESGIFATGHLYQSHNLASALGVLAITFGGGVWFGWLYKSWQNLWVPACMHIFMNGWWMLFDVADTVVGSVGANVCRALTVLLSVVATRWYLRRQAARPAAEPVLRMAPSVA